MPSAEQSPDSHLPELEEAYQALASLPKQRVVEFFRLSNQVEFAYLQVGDIERAGLAEAYNAEFGHALETRRRSQ